MRSILLFSLIFIAFAGPVRAQDDDDCDRLLKSPAELSFPRELRLSPEKIEVLLKTEEFGPLVSELGSLFRLLETQPEILRRLPYAFNGAMGEPKQTHGLPPLLSPKFAQMSVDAQRRFGRRYLQLQGAFSDGLLTNSHIAWLAFLATDLEVPARILSEYDETNAEEVNNAKLSSLQKALFNRPAHQELFAAMMDRDKMWELLGEDFNGILARILSAGYTLDESLYRVTYHEILDSVEEWEEIHDQILASTPRGGKRLAQEQFKHLWGLVTYLVVNPALAAEGHTHIYEDELNLVIREGRDLVMTLAEEIYFSTGFREYDHQTFMDLMDFIIYGTPLPQHPPQIMDAMLDMANRVLLPAKSYASTLKAQQAQALIESRKLDVQLQPFALQLRPEVLPQRSEKKRYRRGETARNEPVPVAVAALENDLLDFTKFAERRRALGELDATTVYQFKILREKRRNDDEKTVHRLRIKPDALAAMAAQPNEAYQLIDGILTGFVSRHHDGAGLKRIYSRSSITEDLYEGRPNRGDFRMILSREKGLWTILAFVPKTQFFKELDRLRGP